MKKLEYSHRFRISENKECAIIFKYPLWMKCLMRFVECYFIPDIKDYKIVNDFTCSDDAEDKLEPSALKEMVKQLRTSPPKFKYGIGDIT